MSTTIEHLPVEIWFQTFVYLKASDRFEAFSNLNKRLDDILLASQTKISLKSHDNEAYYLLRHVLPKLTHRQYVTGLRLERTNKIDLEYYAGLFDFPQIDTLILHRLDVNKELLNIIRNSLTHLRYLNISTKMSINYKMNSVLLQLVLTLPHLQMCSMRLTIATHSCQLSNELQSPMRSLKLLDKKNICFVGQLRNILSHLPNLHSLNITAKQLSLDSVVDKQNIDSYRTEISSLTLYICEFAMPFVQLTEFLSNFAPNLTEFKLTIISSFPDTSCLDYHTWTVFIKSLSKLKTVTLHVTHANDVQERTWKKCRVKLIDLMRENLIQSEIRSAV
ncbi:unnamed protein product [Adineta ricciae]|uniref:F-box domain-containing protein n=1 Tax=Adineta ricciae TaxID=249248 RepID=A0A813Y8Y4_ADIRI|nr:unnamed protein product [Adineta ricciae]CAF1143165.1 unnamed protein product [Adineta ricciae]